MVEEESVGCAEVTDPEQQPSVAIVEDKPSMYPLSTHTHIHTYYKASIDTSLIQRNKNTNKNIQNHVVLLPVKLYMFDTNMA